MMQEYFIVYFFIINLMLFTLMLVDKLKAKHHKHRISESTLWMIAILGGAFGGMMAMHIFKHKNRKTKFIIGFPSLLVLHLVLSLLLI